LRALLGKDDPEGLTSEAVEALLGESERMPAVTAVTIPPVDLTSFDELWANREVVQ
jgi:hypothetical protein